MSNLLRFVLDIIEICWSRDSLCWRKNTNAGPSSNTLYSTRGLGVQSRWWAAAAAASFGLFATAPARADSLFDALASTYVTNPNLNAARAAVRSADEDVPQALSGYRPTIGLTADLGVETDRSTTNGKWSTPLYPRGFAFTVEQPLFRGFQTKNSVGAAESSVKATREQLRGIEQDTLLSAVQAFMDVVQGQVVVNLRAQNVAFLREQVRAATDRLNVGEGTKTDVAQANASLSSGISGYAAAVARLNAAIATYEQVVGHKPTKPRRRQLDRSSPAEVGRSSRSTLRSAGTPRSSAPATMSTSRRST